MMKMKNRELKEIGKLYKWKTTTILATSRGSDQNGGVFSGIVVKQDNEIDTFKVGTFGTDWDIESFILSNEIVELKN